MPKHSENTHSESTPHFDERRDQVISVSQETRMSIRIDKTKQNPYSVTALNNEDLKEFQSLFRGKIIEKISEHEKTEL